MAAPAGGRRNTAARSAKQVTRRDKRLADPRVRAALEEIRQHNEYLEATMAEQEGEIGARKCADGDHGPVFIGDRYACCGRLVPEEVLIGMSVPTPVLEKEPEIKRETPPAPRLKPNPTVLPLDGDGNGSWTLGQARSMLMQGYLLEHVVRMTGFGTRWFSDIPLRDGRGVSREEWIASL